MPIVHRSLLIDDELWRQVQLEAAKEGVSASEFCSKLIAKAMPRTGGVIPESQLPTLGTVGHDVVKVRDVVATFSEEDSNPFAVINKPKPIIINSAKAAADAVEALRRRKA